MKYRGNDFYGKAILFLWGPAPISLFMKIKRLLYDYFRRYPQLNAPVPDNHLKLQDTLRKAFKNSRFRLLFTGDDVLTKRMDATFF